MTAKTKEEAAPENAPEQQVRKRLNDLDVNQQGYDTAGYRQGQADAKRAQISQAEAEERGWGANEVLNPYDEHSNIGISWQAGFDAGPDGDPTAGINLGADTGPDDSNILGTSHMTDRSDELRPDHDIEGPRKRKEKSP